MTERRRARGRTALIIGCGLLAFAAAGKPAVAARFALFIGNNEGRGADQRLRFAENDAFRLADILKRLGGFTPDATIELGSSAREIHRALGVLADRLRATPGEHLAVVYYSGHADAQALHLGSSSLPLTELRDIVTALPAATRVLILDACQAGVLTRAKGGAPGAGFEIELGGPQGQATGLAVLASSAGSELAQESDELGGSVFTHYLQAGLRGLADRNHDGNVSLSEVFDYTANRTLAATIATAAGPQHPTFRLDLSGRDDLVLTQPGLTGAGYGRLRLDVPGWYFVRRDDGGGDKAITGEVTSHGDVTLALEPGRYEITRREPSRLDVASVEMVDGGTAAVSAAPERIVAFGRMVRKGGGPGAAYGLAVMAAARSPVQDMGASLGGAVAGRVDLSALSIELRATMGHAHSDAQRLSSETWDTSLAVAALRMHDGGGSGARGADLRSNLTFGFGLEAGASYMTERLDDGVSHAAVSPFLGPVGLAELFVGAGRRFFLRAGLAAPIYALHANKQDGTGSVTRWSLAIDFAAGGGASF